MIPIAIVQTAIAPESALDPSITLGIQGILTPEEVTRRCRGERISSLTCEFAPAEFIGGAGLDACVGDCEGGEESAESHRVIRKLWCRLRLV